MPGANEGAIDVSYTGGPVCASDGYAAVSGGSLHNIEVHALPMDGQGRLGHPDTGAQFWACPPFVDTPGTHQIKICYRYQSFYTGKAETVSDTIQVQIVDFVRSGPQTTVPDGSEALLSLNSYAAVGPKYAQPGDPPADADSIYGMRGFRYTPSVSAPDLCLAKADVNYAIEYGYTISGSIYVPNTSTGSAIAGSVCRRIIGDELSYHEQGVSVEPSRLTLGLGDGARTISIAGVPQQASQAEYEQADEGIKIQRGQVDIDHVPGTELLHQTYVDFKTAAGVVTSGGASARAYASVSGFPTTLLTDPVEFRVAP